MEPEGSLPLSQKLVTFPYPEQVAGFRDKWVQCCHHGMARRQVAANKGWSSSLVVGWGAKNS
jgi:hypothetical protein